MFSNLFKNKNAQRESSTPRRVGPSDRRKKPTVEFEHTIGIPDHYIAILSDNGGRFFVQQTQRQQLAVLEIRKGVVALLATDSAIGGNQYLTLKEKIKASGYLLAIESKVTTGELLTLYSSSSENKDEKKSEDFSSGENKKMLHYIVSNAVQKRATDIHICPRHEFGTGVIMFRIDGRLSVWERMPADALVTVCGYMFTKEAEESSRSDPAFNPKAMQSCSIPIKIDKNHLKLRYQSIRVNGGFDVVLRLLFTDKESKVASLETLGYSPSQVRDLDLAVRKTVGGIFIAGVTGSGKSTTLKTLMSLSPTRHERKFYSIEDPVEYKMFGVSQISVQRSSNDQMNNGNAFLEPMRVILRADPDTIMPGEIRDEESCSMMKGMIQSGHQVMTSIHASSAVEIIERVCSKEFGLPRQSLSSRSFISALVYQRLLPKVCTKCSKPAQEVLPEEKLTFMKEKFMVDISKMKASVEDHDCPVCNGTGTHGVTVVAEIILPDLTFLKHVRDSKDMDAEEHWRKSRKTGFGNSDMTGKTAFEHGLYKVLAGICDLRDLEEGFEPIETYQIIDVDIRQINASFISEPPSSLFNAVDLNDVRNTRVVSLEDEFEDAASIEFEEVQLGDLTGVSDLSNLSFYNDGLDEDIDKATEDIDKDFNDVLKMSESKN